LWAEEPIKEALKRLGPGLHHIADIIACVGRIVPRSKLDRTVLPSRVGTKIKHPYTWQNDVQWEISHMKSRGLVVHGERMGYWGLA